MVGTTQLARSKCKQLILLAGWWVQFRGNLRIAHKREPWGSSKEFLTKCRLQYWILLLPESYIFVGKVGQLRCRYRLVNRGTLLIFTSLQVLCLKLRAKVLFVQSLDHPVVVCRLDVRVALHHSLCIVVDVRDFRRTVTLF